MRCALIKRRVEERNGRIGGRRNEEEDREGMKVGKGMGRGRLKRVK